MLSPHQLFALAAGVLLIAGLVFCAWRPQAVVAHARSVLAAGRAA